MIIRIKISKQLLLKVAIFAALIGVAVILDNYFEKNPVDFSQMEANSSKTTFEHGTIYIFAQGNPLGEKTSVQKTPDRRMLQKSHDKLLQKYHQIRNYQCIKADSQIRKTPMIMACHYLVFRNYFYPVPDDEPLIS